MGLSLSRLFARLFSKKDLRILMVGLDSAGKTTILYKLKLGTTIQSIPTLGFNVETINIKNVKFNVWDVGGQDRMRPLWRHYFTGTQGLVFVVDSSDGQRMEEAKEEFHNIVSDREMMEVPVLVFGNKKDVEGALDEEQVTDRLALHKLRDRDWHIVLSCALTGEGLKEGLTWLGSRIRPL
eukprot:TRINITY_DN345_c0_g1_i1.p1 TRINITY_DN345_c0_g1~~TRINITY_DN345_c0_g1_i1.p1  ORF type:complete len:181 (+),score=44.85 TRINITY_DN345_c0_g1_i1:139-681(+)